MPIKHTKEDLEAVIKSSSTWAEVCRKLNVKPASGAQTHLKKRAILFGIDFSHFVGQAWSRGKTFAKRPLENYLQLNGASINSDTLKKRLLRDGLKQPICERCKLSHWFNEVIPLELHHKNGNRLDNRLENLEILCPNCHALTNNHYGKKRGECNGKVNAFFVEH